MSARTTASALVIGFVALATSWGAAFAEHGSGVVVTPITGECGVTTISATSPAGNPLNMYLVVYADGVTQSANIPVGEGAASTTVGPFFTHSGETTAILWRVFGGAERNYDSPHWIGFDEPGFNAAVNAYAEEVGGFGWVLAGPDDPNPFTDWNELSVESCAITKDDCMNGGWATYGFTNQGRCIQFVNTGEDSR